MLRSQEAKEAREARQKEDEERREAAAEQRRRARKEERVTVDDEDLEGMKGYKLRSDGSKTSYFTREVDEEVRAMLDAQKAPKRLSVGTAASPSSLATADERAGSAWNCGGTWEEKDLSEWAKGELERRLQSVSATSDGVLKATVSKVKDVEGAASVVASRGASRHLCEYSFELEYKLTRARSEAAVELGGGAEGGGDGDAKAEGEEKPASKTAKKVCSGSLCYSDVTASSKDSQRLVEVGGVINRYTSEPAAADAGSAAAAIETLKRCVLRELEQFDEELKAKKV